MENVTTSRDLSVLKRGIPKPLARSVCVCILKVSVLKRVFALQGKTLAFKDTLLLLRAIWRPPSGQGLHSDPL